MGKPAAAFERLLNVKSGMAEDTGEIPAIELVSQPGSLADLYRERYVPMVRLAYLMVGSTPVAEELVQDAFARMHRHWDRAEHPRAYLRTSVVNACRSHLRRGALERAYLKRAAHESEAAAAGGETSSSTPSPSFPPASGPRWPCVLRGPPRGRHRRRPRLPPRNREVPPPPGAGGAQKGRRPMTEAGT